MGSWTNLHTGRTPLIAFPTFTEEVDVKSILTATGRIGWAFRSAALIYVKGGVAWKREDFTIFQPSGAVSETANATMRGWTIGGGLEYRIAQNISLFVEGNHMDFGKERVGFTAAPGTFGGPDVVEYRQKVTTIIGGLNFRWNWAGPVVARY
jgi:outer membrane immunogenic protein